jgi:hypothetical protein
MKLGRQKTRYGHQGIKTKDTRFEFIFIHLYIGFKVLYSSLL